MPILMSDRAHLISPLPLIAAPTARVLGISLSPDRWARVRKGVYVERERFQNAAPWVRYAIRVHAFLLRHPDAVLCLESSGVLHGLPHFGETKHIHVYDPDATVTEARGDVRIHASVDSRAIEQVGQFWVTDLADTVIDLARLVPPAEGLAIADAALSPVQGGNLELPDLQSRSERVTSRGRARMRWVLGNADGRSESPNESVSRAVITWSGFERPELQVIFHYEGHEDRGDFFFEGVPAIGEADGWQKYQLMEPAEAAAALRAEKRREDRLRRQGNGFARWEPSDAWKVTPLRDALESAGVRRLFAPDSAMLASLWKRPRALPRRRA